MLTESSGAFLRYTPTLGVTSMSLWINGQNQSVTQNGIPVAGIQTNDLVLARDYTQGYYGLLSNFYFTGGVATETEIELEDTNTWLDVNIDVDALGLFDNRPSSMKGAQANGHTGAGTQADPIIFNLEGLDVHAHANFRASMTFEPDIDESQLQTRLLFNRHSGTTPSDDFSIEEVTLEMNQGADLEYAAEPMLSFFVGDTIDTGVTA